MTDDEIKIQKQISDFFRQAERNSKQPCCAICGEECSSYAKSHSIPQFIMKNIAVNSKFKTFSDIVGRHSSKNAVANAWTFHIICTKCENKYFSDYENEETLLKEPTNLIMAEIALKNVLLMLSKYRVGSETNKEAIKIGAFTGETDVLDIMNTLDIENMCFEVRRSRKIIDKKLKSGYKLIYYKKLDWVTPIAFQSAMCLYRSIDGTIINQIYSESKDIRMQQLHICVFPLKEQSVIMVFVHKDDRNYILFERQFLKLDETKKLEYINYLIFKYTEHMLISPSIDSMILNTDKLVDLCHETNANLFGWGQNVLPSEIPNFLSKDFVVHPKNNDA